VPASTTSSIRPRSIFLVVDRRVAELEAADPDGVFFVEVLVGGEPSGHVLRRCERARRPDLEQVEAVVAAGEASGEEVGAEVGLEAAQHHLLAGLEGGDDLGSFAGGELNAVEALRPFQKAAVGRDQLELALVSEADVVDAGVGGVEEPEADALVTDIEVRVVGAVDEDRVAEAAGGADPALGEVERAVVVQPLVLDDERDVVDAVVRWELQSVGVRVVEDE
jgi:hypothetical protein